MTFKEICDKAKLIAQEIYLGESDYYDGFYIEDDVIILNFSKYCRGEGDQWVHQIKEEDFCLDMDSLKIRMDEYLKEKELKLQLERERRAKEKEDAINKYNIELEEKEKKEYLRLKEKYGS